MTAPLVSREQSSHWYLPNGLAFHEIEKLDGSGMRPVTVRDARKHGAFPSVTNILRVIAKPALDAWKIEQAIMASLTLPKLDEEQPDSFAKRVVIDMNAQVREAAIFGTALHDACENYAMTEECPADEKVMAHFKAWKQWFDDEVEEVISAENVLVSHNHGYAGRVDLIARVKNLGTCVVDFKTQKVKEYKGVQKSNFYETWPLQLSAYGAVHGKIDNLLSIVIDSGKPGPIYTKVWENPDGYFPYFLSALSLWIYAKEYNPIKTS